MTRLDASALEKRTLRHSVHMVVFYVLVSIAFALATRSDAILFDGLYSSISLIMGFITLWVARLAERPEDDRFHFGYGALEPFLNMCKSAITIVICVFAAAAAVHRLLGEGSDAVYVLGIYYGAISSALCFIMEGYLRRANRHIQSDLVAVEAKTWFMDGLLSVAVLLGFLVANMLSQSDWPELATKADPVIVLVLVIVTLPVPGKILIQSVREVIVMAPHDDFIGEIEQRLGSSLSCINAECVEYRVSKRGRWVHVLAHVVLPESAGQLTLRQLDAIRRQSTTSMQAWRSNIRLHIIFTQDPVLIGE